MEEKNKVTDLVERTFKDIDLSVEAYNVLGEKIINEKGQTAVPVNAVTVVAMSGGGEYGKVKLASDGGEKFAGGSVTIKTIKPQYFIIDNGNGFTVTDGLDPFCSLFNFLKDIAGKIKK